MEGEGPNSAIRSFIFAKRGKITHSRFRGSVNCGATSIENRFQVAKFYLKSKRFLVFFCLVQNGPGVTWVACIGLKVVLKGCKVVLEAFLNLLFHLQHTVTASCAHGIPKNYGKWIVMLIKIMAPDGPLIFIIFTF